MNRQGAKTAKMLRPYFLHHRELLGGLARAAWETVRELMVAATGEESLRPGMVVVVQTAGDLATWHPHVHALVSLGGWTRAWEWVPISRVDTNARRFWNGEMDLSHPGFQVAKDYDRVSRKFP